MKKTKKTAAMAKIKDSLTDLAVKTLEDFLNDRSINPRVRLTAARDILDRAGVSHAQESALNSDNLADLPTDALRAIVNGASVELSERAKPVSAQDSDDYAGQVPGLFD
jgi:hypothetical protein